MAPRRSEQASIRVVIQRAGTSKGLFLHKEDLPPPGPSRDRLLARLMGSPDVLQVDGLGGSRPITSKVAIVSVSEREDADVDYTFAQVDIASAGVGYVGNCGNISAGVGPFAVDEGLVEVREGVTRIRIYNTNTDKLLIADVPVRGGVAAVEGAYVVPGVPGSGAEIAMNWVATIGSVTGKLLPTGSPADTITLEDGRTLQASLVDAGNPCVWIKGADLGLSGTETQSEINKDAPLRTAVGEVRAKAAVLFGFADDWKRADLTSPGLPMLGLVSRPVDYETLNGVRIGRDEMDLRLHLIFMGVLHESVAGTGSICLAAASRIPGSTVHETADSRRDSILRIGHPSGVTPAIVEAEPTGEAPYVTFRNLGFSRTARRLMDGRAYYPRSLLDEAAETQAQYASA